MANRYSDGTVQHEVVRTLQLVNHILVGRSVVRISTSVTGGKQFQVVALDEPK